MGNEQTRELSAEERRRREISEMDWEVKQKLGVRGQKFNMKVVIKGERNTGKTTLWRRLQGLPFEEGYIPTPEIQVCNINWAYKATDDVVKVEVWDVVDKAKKKKREGMLKVQEDDDDEAPSAEELAEMQRKVKAGGSYTLELDASVIDIFKGTHAVIVTMDPTKKWTFDYAQREIEKIPPEIPTALVVNYRDMSEHRTVSERDIKEWVKFQGREYLRSFETCMVNDYGLKTVVTFFNIPFLKLQRSYIEQQLARNAADLEAVEEEFKLVSKDQNYDFYVKWYEQSKKNNKGKLKNSLTQSNPSLNVEAIPSPAPARKEESPRSAPVAVKEVPKPVPEKPAPKPVEKPVEKPAEKAQPLEKQQSAEKVVSPPVARQAAAPEPPKEEAAPKSGFFGRLVSRGKPKAEQAPSQPAPTKKAEDDLKSLAATKKRATENIDDFEVPVEDDFFGGEDGGEFGGTIGGDDDDDKPNPMLLQDEDIEGDYESSEEEPPKPVEVKPKVEAKPKVESRQREEVQPARQPPKAESPPPEFRREEYAMMDDESEEEPVEVKPVSPPVVKKAAVPTKTAVVTAPVPKPAAVVSPVPAPKLEKPQVSPRSKSKKKPTVIPVDEGTSSEDDRPNKFVVIPTENGSDSDGDLFNTIASKKYDDDDDEDDPFNPNYKGGDDDFERILKPIKPYPNPSNGGTAHKPSPSTQPAQEPNPEKPKKGRRKPPPDETPEQRAARKKRHAQRKKKSEGSKSNKDLAEGFL